MRGGARGIPVLLVALAAAWAGHRAAAKETTMDEAVFGKVERVYVGRFSLEVPAGARRYGEHDEVRDLTLSEVDLTPRSDRSPRDEAWQAAWASKLAEIAQIKAKRLRPTWIDGEVHSRHDLEPGTFAAVLYHTDNVKIAVQYAALRQVGAAGLWLSRPGDTEDIAPTLATIKAVGKAYQARPAGAPPAKGDVFHLPHGAIALPFHEQETAKAVFQGGPLDVEVKVLTESTDEPKGGGLMARFGEAVAKAGAAFAAGASPVRNRGRKAAGLAGEEFVMRDSEDHKLYFMWEFKGEASSGLKPRVQLQMITKDERQKEKMAFWDAVVDSLRPAGAP
jgi:hypothetical protein